MIEATSREVGGGAVVALMILEDGEPVITIKDADGTEWGLFPSSRAEAVEMYLHPFAYRPADMPDPFRKPEEVEEEVVPV